MRFKEISEGVGRITPQNQTADVGPNEIKTQAKKFGNTVDKDGFPPTLSKKTKGKSTNVLYNLGLSESEKSVSEIAKDVDLGKDWVSANEFDEYIGNAKPTRFSIKGYKVWRVPARGEIADTLLIKDPGSEGFLGELTLFNTDTGDKTFVHSQVAFDEEIQGKGLAVPLYAYAIRNLGYTVVSDRTQTKGSQVLWARLAKVPGIFVYGWSVQSDEFFQWDPDVDPEDEVYHDPGVVNELRLEMRKYRAEVDTELRAGRISEEEADKLLNKKDNEIRAKMNEIDKIRWKDLRLVATSTKGLGK